MSRGTESRTAAAYARLREHLAYLGLATASERLAAKLERATTEMAAPVEQASLIQDADYLAILTPQHYRSVDQSSSIQAYRNTQALLDAVYTSQRLRLPPSGVLALGY